MHITSNKIPCGLETQSMMAIHMTANTTSKVEGNEYSLRKEYPLLGPR